VARRGRGGHHEEHADERWLLTYADMITLLFVLFIVLFSISVVNTSKFDLLKRTLAQAFSSGVVNGGASVLPETAAVKPAPITDTPPLIRPDVKLPNAVDLQNASPEQALETRQLASARAQVQAAAKRAGLSGEVRTSVDERGLTIRLMTDGVLYASGSASLEPGAGRILTPIARVLRTLPNPIRVEGHTDSNPISTGSFPSNWELSGARAAGVVRFFAAGGVPSARLQGGEFAATRPVASNATAAGRARNRRIEVLVLRLQGAPGQTAASALGG
jgi:chemotaxis protein MotB